MSRMIRVIKRNSGEEIFSPEKLCASLHLIGAGKQLSRSVCKLIEQSLVSEVSTDEIFRLTRDFLYERNPSLAALYALERGLSALGPSGFAFEQFVAAIFYEMGYEVQTNVYIPGEAVTHEIDVWAKKGNVIFLSEAKYKNDFKLKTHIDKVMYADARLQDIRRRAHRDGDTYEYHMWVITNTRFTDNAILYAKHRDIQLVGWNYPHDINLMSIVYEKRLFPVTVLPSITKYALKQMSRMDLILVRYLKDFSAAELKRRFQLSSKLAHKLHAEIQHILGESEKLPSLHP